MNYVGVTRAGESTTNWVVPNAKQPNTYGRLIDRMRYGLVASQSQQDSLDLQLDCASIGYAAC
jgi:hypothetical protein